MEEENSNKTEEVTQTKEIKKNIKNDKKGNNKKLICILVAIIVLLAGATCYFAFIKGNDDKKESNNNNSSNNKKDDKNKNDIINYEEITKKVNNAKKNTLIKCDCSKVKSETDVDKAVCTEYSVSNEDFIRIIDKLENTADVKVLPTGTTCSSYVFASYDSKDKEIISGFVSDDQKSILAGYNDEGYAFDYKEKVNSFFDSIISTSTKVDKKDDKKDDEARALSEDEIASLISKIKKYELLDLRNSEKKVSFNNTLTNEMMNSMFDYVTGLDNSFSEHWETETTWSFKKSKADEYFNNAFGFTPKEYSNLICPVENEALLIYDKTNGTFTYNDEHPGHGGPATGFIDYKVTDSKKDGELYSIDVLFLRGNEMDGYYINDEEFNIEVPEDEEENVSMYKKAFKNISASKYTRYTFAFEKVNNNFVLKSIAPKK